MYLPIPSNQLFRPGSVIGNSGLKGRWVYQVDTLPAKFVNPRLQCRKWHSTQRFDFFYYILYFVHAHTCPCSMFMARFDRRFVPITYSYVLPKQRRSGYGE